MDPERWREIERLYHLALEQEPAQQSRFVAEACLNDAELRGEVESLLAQSGGTERLVDQTAWAEADDLAVTRTVLTPGERLGPYQILGLLGEGGMGKVYRALDTRLGRAVAIKISAEQFTKRFEREARAISALNHPHICTLYDVGPNYMVTELVEGETLRDWLERAPAVERSIEIARQVLGALRAAHRAGIVHRDLKPQNIMVRFDGYVKVLDFGLAKRIPVSGALRTENTATTGASLPGQILGTVAYMSPEQIMGREIDQRSDLFAFGIILYEMLMGQHPWPHKSSVDTLHAILHDDPPPMDAVASLSAELAHIVRRLLCKSPAERYPSAEPVLKALADGAAAPQESHVRGGANAKNLEPSPMHSPRKNRIVLWSATMLVLFLAAVSFYRFGRYASAIDTLAVLPFVNGSTDPQVEYLGDGISETLITQLSQVPRLKIKSRDSAFPYKGKDAQTAGRALGVRAVLKGRIEQWSDNLSIVVELVDTKDNNLIWSDQYNRKMGDIVATEEEISREVCEKLRFKLTGEEQKQLSRGSTENADAHQLYLKGRHLWDRRSEENFKKSLEYFQQAIDKDPGYALAWAGLADSYNMLAAYGVSPRPETYPLAKAAAEKALRLDSNLAEALATLAREKTEYEWDWDGAERMYKRAIELNPNYGTAHQGYAVHLAAIGRPLEAVAEARRARELEPLSPAMNANVAWFYYLARQYGQAEEESRKAIELDSGYSYSHWILGSVYLQTGRQREALAEFRQALAISKDSVMELMYLGHGLAVSGARAEAQRVLDQMKDMSHRRYVPPEYLAVVYVGLGDRDRAFQWFEKAYAERSMHSWVYPDPRLDPIRADLRFKSLKRRMGLPQ
jgi:eukaryotic-like serine/threonine-protein kinase